MIPNELVHYTNKEIALEHILYEKKIKFGLLGMTNDPKETKEWGFPLLTTMEDSLFSKSKSTRNNIDFTISVQDIVNEIMTKEWKVLCLTKHSTYNHKRVLSEEFSRAYSHPGLWAHYGENHSGVCIIFNQKKLNKNIHNHLSKDHKIFQGSVEYNNIRAIVQSAIDVSNSHLNINDLIREYFINNYEDCFLRKTTDWKFEHEYRWLIHDVKKEPIFIPISGAINGVIVGPDFPKVYETTLEILCKEMKIYAGKIHWYNGMPRVNKSAIYSP